MVNATSAVGGEQEAVHMSKSGHGSNDGFSSSFVQVKSSTKNGSHARCHVGLSVHTRPAASPW